MPDIKYDQTETIRINEAKKKARGTDRSQCSGGCGRYLTEDEKATHKCPGPPKFKRKKGKRGWQAAMRRAAKEGKLMEFIEKL